MSNTAARRRSWVSRARPASACSCNPKRFNQRESTMNQNLYQAAIAAFDKANAEDPNKEVFNGNEYPKELLYAQRMTEMQERFAPEASDAVKLACRAQHI